MNFIFLFKKAKGGIFRRNWGLTWRGTHADTTWHARPRGRAERAHAAPRWHGGGADAWQGPHDSTRTPGCRHMASEGAGR